MDDTTIDFFYSVTSPSVASELAKVNVRSIYPEARIFEYNENLETFKKGVWVNRVDLQEYYALSPESSVKFIELLNRSIQLSNAEWMMILEPDVLLLKKITNFPKGDAAGMVGNLLLPEYVENLSKELDIVQPFFSMAGGSIINVKSWKNKFKGFTIDDFNRLRSAWYEVGSTDTNVTVALWLNGMKIEEEQWQELFEIGPGQDSRALTSSVFHGNKLFYSESWK
jgi:hypothetical protein